MIDHLDNLLHRLFRNRVNQLSADGQIRFQPPDDEWRAMVPGITDGLGNPGNSLNIYLADLRENRTLRTNARERSVVGLDVIETPPPRRVDCHYLISAWSPIEPSPGIDPTPDEHALLADATRVLGEHDDLDPEVIYGESNPPVIPPAAIANERFPLTILPVDGFPTLGEFWGTMGNNHRWKPCLYAVVTIALREAHIPAGPMVTTTITSTQTTNVQTSAETRYHVGGTVYDNAVPPEPAGLAWVELLTPANERHGLTRADASGRFIFHDVAAGNWRLRASNELNGVSPIRDITVPEPSGHYDLSY